MFANAIKELRNAKGLSQADLAKEFNVAQQTVGKWEKGITCPFPDTLQKIADYFHVSTDYLLGRKTTAEDMKSMLLQPTDTKANPDRLELMKLIPRIPNNKLLMARSLMEVLTKDDYNNMA